MRSTLYTNGSILTMEPGPRPEALLVTDGRIAALGGAATLSALAPDAERRDLAGGALLPAFLDAHSHITALAATMGLCDLSPSTSLHHMADILWTFEEDTDPPADGWILGFGYDHTALAERAHPTRQFLDAALPGRKVLLTHASGHMGVASTAALRAMGITADTPDPEGGRIGREADGRTPSGYLEETAFRLAAARVPAAPQADPLAGLRLAQQIYLSQGITLVQDGLTGAGEFQLLHAAARTGSLAVNVVGYADLKKPQSSLASRSSGSGPAVGCGWAATRSFWTALPRAARPGCWSPTPAARPMTGATPHTPTRRSPASSVLPCQKGCSFWPTVTGTRPAPSSSAAAGLPRRRRTALSGTSVR